jgi:hypothetical protein
MDKTVNIIIILIASLILICYLFKYNQAKDTETKTLIPVDRYGVEIEPNSVQMNNTLAEINSLI